MYKHGEGRQFVRLQGGSASGVPGLWVSAGRDGFLPDDEIPGLVSFLQDYMSRRAREMAKGAKGNG